MRRVPVAVWAVLLACSALLSADVSPEPKLGEVTYVACQPDGALAFRLLFLAGQIKPPTEGDGTVSARAAVAVFRKDDLAVAVAVDSAQPGAKVPDVVRLDFTGQGRFDGSPSVPVKLRSSDPRYRDFRFGPATIEAKRDGRTIPVIVAGRYRQTGTGQAMWVGVSTAAQASYRFGEKTYMVRIIDGTSNLRLGDAAKLRRYRGNVVGVEEADIVAVDVGDGTFNDSRAVCKSFFGQPVLVDGKYYRVSLSPDGNSIAVAPLTRKTGCLRIDQEHYELMLLGGSGVLSLTGSKAPLPVPEGEYKIMQYKQVARDASTNKTWSFQCGRRLLYSNKARTVRVPAGKDIDLKIGAPLVGSLGVGQQGRSFQFDLQLVDAAGTRLDSLVMGSGRPPPPKVKIRDRSGQLVATVQMRYG